MTLTKEKVLDKPILYGKLINLRPIVKEDAQAMFDAFADKEVMRLTGSKSSPSLERIEKWCAKLLKADDRLDYAITLKNDPAYIGEIVLNKIAFEERSTKLRISMASVKDVNKGYGTEAMLLLLKHGFETLGLHRVQLDVFDFNPRAQHVYEKIGFVKEGVIRDDLIWEGKYHDSIMMAMLEDEWFAKYGTQK